MANHDAVVRYKTALAVFKKWRADGVINDDDLRVMDNAVAAKYGLPHHSIYREYNLIRRAA